VILSARHVAGAATVMAHAFIDSPTYRQIYRGDQAHREAALFWLFERNIRAVQKKITNALRGILVDDKVVATFLLVPTSCKFSTWEMVTAGLLWIPFKFGFATFQRLMETIDFMDSHEHLPKEDKRCSGRVTLERMTVLPDWQGQSLGSICVASCLLEAREDNLQLILTTQEERNVRFYSRQGFQVDGESDFKAQQQDDDKYSYHNWFMSFSASASPNTPDSK
jgi:GNAT superfamily N-acetyltransferase